MALNAELQLTTQLQMILVIRSFRIMAGDAGHRLPIPLIFNLLPNGMAEIPLSRMTAHANTIAVTFQHCRAIRAMHLMTFMTEIHVLMLMLLVQMAQKGVLMTFAAQDFLRSPQQHG